MRKDVSARDLLYALVRSSKEMNSQTKVGDSTVYPLAVTSEFQMVNLADWCKALQIDFHRVDWEGNKVCETNHDMIYFDYEGCRFFQLVDKEGENER